MCVCVGVCVCTGGNLLCLADWYLEFCYRNSVRIELTSSGLLA